ncbi:MAG: hypothetical protein ACI38A_06135, partial [Candidatus Ornithomonoglobus sp.]
MDNKHRSGPGASRPGRDDYDSKTEYSRDVNRRADRIDSTVRARRQTPRRDYDTYRRTYAEHESAGGYSYGTRRVSAGYRRTGTGTDTGAVKGY